MSDLAKLLGPMARRMGNLVARGKVLVANSASKMQTLQLGLLAGETKDTVEHFEPFGFTSKPLPGAEHVTLFLDGDRSHGITIVVADRRYRLHGLEDGEAALHDAFGNKVHLMADGTLAVVASAEVQITSPLVTITGDLQVAGTITAGTDVVGGGKSLVSHTHPVGGGDTGPPN
jgi:phage baseplate assembly protein V